MVACNNRFRPYGYRAVGGCEYLRRAPQISSVCQPRSEDRVIHLILAVPNPSSCAIIGERRFPTYRRVTNGITISSGDCLAARRRAGRRIVVSGL